MFSSLNNQDRIERDTLVADIYTVFAVMTRSPHAISWSECVAIDNYEPEDVCEAARQSDKESHWRELVDNPDWDPFPGVGGFSFINGEGFRYYLPPTMIRFLRGDGTELSPGHLLRVVERFSEEHLLPIYSHAQLQCIARFISFMARHDEDVRSSPEEPNPWTNALDQRWNVYLPR